MPNKLLSLLIKWEKLQKKEDAFYKQEDELYKAKNKVEKEIKSILKKEAKFKLPKKFIKAKVGRYRVSLPIHRWGWLTISVKK